LLPADILGAHIYHPKSGELEFIKGPLFSDFVFVDEINRAPPRTQSALLEAMEERQITVEGKTFPLSPSFFVIATQNPSDLEGTFPLPEAQIDRFLIKLKLHSGTEEDERWIVNAALKNKLPLKIDEVHALSFSMEDIQKEIANIIVEASIVDYAVRLVRATREHPLVHQGSSVRGTLGLVRSARVLAAIFGRSFVIPDDIKILAPAVLSHRIQLTPEAELDRNSNELIINELLKKVPFPK
jgi:MoxR-like ATPase